MLFLCRYHLPWIDVKLASAYTFFMQVSFILQPPSTLRTAECQPAQGHLAPAPFQRTCSVKFLISHDLKINVEYNESIIVINSDLQHGLDLYYN